MDERPPTPSSPAQLRLEATKVFAHGRVAERDSTAGSPPPPPPPPASDATSSPFREPLRDITHQFPHVTWSPAASSSEEDESESEGEGRSPTPRAALPPRPLARMPQRSSCPSQAARIRALYLSPSAAIRRRRHSWCIR